MGKYTVSQEDRNDNRYYKKEDSINVEYTVRYYIRGKCTHCNDPMWTTDQICSVTCKCGKSTVTPSGLEGDAGVLTDADHEAYVRAERPDDPSDKVKFIQLI